MDSGNWTTVAGRLSSGIGCDWVDITVHKALSLYNRFWELWLLNYISITLKICIRCIRTLRKKVEKVGCNRNKQRKNGEHNFKIIVFSFFCFPDRVSLSKYDNGSCTYLCPFPSCLVIHYKKRKIATNSHE